MLIKVFVDFLTFPMKFKRFSKELKKITATKSESTKVLFSSSCKMPWRILRHPRDVNDTPWTRHRRQGNTFNLARHDAPPRVLSLYPPIRSSPKNLQRSSAPEDRWRVASSNDTRWEFERVDYKWLSRPRRTWPYRLVAFSSRKSWGSIPV